MGYFGQGDTEKERGEEKGRARKGAEQEAKGRRHKTAKNASHPYVSGVVGVLWDVCGGRAGHLANLNAQ